MNYLLSGQETETGSCFTGGSTQFDTHPMTPGPHPRATKNESSSHCRGIIALRDVVRSTRGPGIRASTSDRLAPAESTDLNHERRFEWLYLRNPAGRGRAWFVCNGDEDHVVGAASVFPSFIWSRGQIALCIQVGDFAVESSFRSLGPALMLQRATLKPVDDGEFSFCYDCPPHDRGMATFHRLGILPACRMGRFVRLLRAGPAFRERFPAGPLVGRSGSVLRQSSFWMPLPGFGTVREQLSRNLARALRRRILVV